MSKDNVSTPLGQGRFDITLARKDDKTRMISKRWKPNSLAAGFASPMPARYTRSLWTIRVALAFLFGIMLTLGVAGQILAQAQEPPALTLEVDGVINPVKERYIARALQQAKDENAALVIIQLDTPGGLGSSTRKIVELLLESPTPIVVYVSPRGAQAGSAGAFITAAAHVAVMAPGTNIGAATPISSTGADLDETLANKVTNDAAALIRSIAQERGRNKDVLEDMVRKGSSLTATEALNSNVIDFVAQDVEDLLTLLDGRDVEILGEPWTIDTSELKLEAVEKNPLEHFLEFISSPDVAFILLTVGGLGIVVELFNPGLIAPGVVGVILLILAFLALGNLPVNWAGVALIVLAIVLALLETQVIGFGILGIGSVICLVLGGFLLFARFGNPSPTLPSISVNPWLIVGVGAAFGMGLLYLVWMIRKSRAEEPGHGPADKISQVGRVIIELAPRGLIRMDDGNWTAVSDDDTVIPVGERVIVIGVTNLILTVIPYEELS